MMESQLQESKRRLQQNSQNSQNQVLANKLFKSLKQSFEGIKLIIHNVEDQKTQTEELNDLKQQLLTKEQKAKTEQIRLMEQHQVNLEYHKAKHQTDMADLQKEEDIILEKEIPALRKEIAQLTNDLSLTEQRLYNIKAEQEFFASIAKEYAKMI